MDYQNNKQFDRTQSEQPSITGHLLYQHMLFFILLCLLDIVLLVLHIDNLKYLAAKLVIDSIVTILVIIFRSKINFKQMNIFLAIVKLTTLTIIAFIGFNVIVLVVFISEINSYPEQNIEFIKQRIITKMGGLIIIIISSSILDIIIILFILLMETSNLYIYFQCKKIQQNEHFLSNLHSRTPRESSSICYKENNWINKIQRMPIGIILFTANDLKIIYSNQVCYYYFNSLCQTQAELEEIVLDKLQFQIVKKKKNDDDPKQTLKQFKKSFDLSLSVKESENQTISISYSDIKLTLRSILTLCQEGQFKKDINQQTNSLELQCQLSQDSGIQLSYSCQMNINQDEGEIQLVLLDITQYHHIQIEDIQDQFKAQVVQSFSHELRTPLNSACNFLQCCLSDKNIQKETRQKLIKPAYNSLRLQSHLINDIIDFSCFFAHGIELELKEFYIKDLIDEVNQLFKSSIEMKKLALYVDLYENEFLKITTDFARLMQIIVNLLQNAIKYSTKGIIILKLSNFSTDQVKFTVKDEGIGISEDRFIQIQQMLQEIEKRPGPPKHKKWHGFGLLVSQMLLLKLCPKNFKSLLVRSEGRDQGTKVSFYIKNHSGSSTPSSSGLNVIHTLRQISKVKLSFPSLSKQLSINGTMIQISDKIFSPNQIIWKKNNTFKSHELCQNVDSQLINEVDQKMNGLNHVRPTLITEIGGKSKQLTNEFQMIESPVYQSARDLQAQKVLSYNQLKLKDAHDSDKLINEIFKRRKCTCKRILSVDDEIFNQKSIQFLLSKQGFDVTLAFNGEEAIQVIKEIERCSTSCNLFMVILMDYQMPIMDGIQTTKALRQMMLKHVIPQIHIVGLTAFHGKKDIQNCIEAGMSYVLAKPLKIKEFFEILNLL